MPFDAAFEALSHKGVACPSRKIKYLILFHGSRQMVKNFFAGLSIGRLFLEYARHRYQFF